MTDAGLNNKVFVTLIDYITAPASFGRLFQRLGMATSTTVRNIAIKINLCDYRCAESGATTDPIILDSLIQELHRLFPNAMVYIVENDASAVEANSLFKLLGIEMVAQKRGAALHNATHGEWILKAVPDGKIFQEFEVPAIIDRSDLFVNFAKLKTNSFTKVTGCLKNTFGLLRVKHKAVYHPKLDKVLVDMNKVYKPDLCIVDGYIGMEGVGGPAFGKPKRCNLLIGGTNSVSVDACCSRIMGFNPWFVKHIRLCHRAGIGNIRYKQETDIPDFDFSEYRFEFERMQFFIRNLIRNRIGIGA
jgi:uncharacterized protein (DUF362 family)